MFTWKTRTLSPIAELFLDCARQGRQGSLWIGSIDITAAPGIRIPPDYRRMRTVGGRQGDPLGG